MTPQGGPGREVGYRPVSAETWEGRPLGGGRMATPSLGRTVLRMVMLLVILLAVLLLAGGWYFADRLTEPPEVRPFAPDTRVVAADGAIITLATTDDLLTGGRFGLQLPDGEYAALGPFVAHDEDTTTYEVVEYTGDVPAPDTPARVDEYWRTGTPASLGLTHDDVVVPGLGGDLPAWWVEGGDEGTVVFVHGRGATREEALRFLPVLTERGWDTLVISWRGDTDAAPLRDARLRWGTEEWADVESAVDWVVDEAGQDRPIVLFGSSLGGALVGQFLDRSPLEDEVDGVVLDSPVLSLDATLDLQANLNGVPEFVEPLLLPTTELVAGLMYGVDTPSLEQTDDDRTFDVPTLLFHGAQDDFVPFTPSLRLSQQARRVEYVGIEGAGHVRSWNADSERYEQALAEFLAGIG